LHHVYHGFSRFSLPLHCTPPGYILHHTPVWFALVYTLPRTFCTLHAVLHGLPLHHTPARHTSHTALPSPPHCTVFTALFPRLVARLTCTACLPPHLVPHHVPTPPPRSGSSRFFVWICDFHRFVFCHTTTFPLRSFVRSLHVLRSTSHTGFSLRSTFLLPAFLPLVCTSLPALPHAFGFTCVFLCIRSHTPGLVHTPPRFSRFTHHLWFLLRLLHAHWVHTTPLCTALRGFCHCCAFHRTFYHLRLPHWVHHRTYYTPHLTPHSHTYHVCVCTLRSALFGLRLICCVLLPSLPFRSTTPHVPRSLTFIPHTPPLWFTPHCTLPHHSFPHLHLFASHCLGSTFLRHTACTTSLGFSFATFLPGWVYIYAHTARFVLRGFWFLRWLVRFALGSPPHLPRWFYLTSRSHTAFFHCLPSYVLGFTIYLWLVGSLHTVAFLTTHHSAFHTLQFVFGSTRSTHHVLPFCSLLPPVGFWLPLCHCPLLSTCTAHWVPLHAHLSPLPLVHTPGTYTHAGFHTPRAPLVPSPLHAPPHRTSHRVPLVGYTHYHLGSAPALVYICLPRYTAHLAVLVALFTHTTSPTLPHLTAPTYTRVCLHGLGSTHTPLTACLQFHTGSTHVLVLVQFSSSGFGCSYVAPLSFALFATGSFYYTACTPLPAFVSRSPPSHSTFHVHVATFRFTYRFTVHVRSHFVCVYRVPLPLDSHTLTRIRVHTFYHGHLPLLHYV